MASEPILAVEENIDEQIIEFCKTRHGLSEEQVVRDIARIVCSCTSSQTGRSTARTPSSAAGWR